MSEETITITMRRYIKLRNDERFLIALRSVGVDNWIGWDDACERYSPYKDEDDYE